MIIRKWNGTDTWDPQAVETTTRSIRTSTAKFGSTTEADYVFTSAGKIKAAHLPDFVFGGMQFAASLSSFSDSSFATAIDAVYQDYGQDDLKGMIGKYFIATGNVTIVPNSSTQAGSTGRYYQWDAGREFEEDSPDGNDIVVEHGDWVVIIGASQTGSNPYNIQLSVVNNTYQLATGSQNGIMSSSDFTKLAGIATSANNYVHPTHPGDDINLDTGALTGATVISDLDFNITSDTSGHITDANASYATRTLTLANLGYTGATDANNYVHPTHPGDDFDIDTGALTGATVISDLDINLTSDSLGHITDANATVATRTLTLADLGYSAPGNGTHTVSGTTDQVSISTAGGAFTANKGTTTTTTVSLSYPVYYADTEGALSTDSSVPTNAIGFEY